MIVICPDCGGKRYRRNPDSRRRELERRARQGDFRSQVQLLQLKMRSGEIPVDYVRCAAALGDKRAEALGLEPWTVSSNYRRFIQLILELLPETLIVSFAADVAERVLYIFEDAFPGDTRPREAIEAARRWVEDPSEENADAAAVAAAAAFDAADDASWASRTAARATRIASYDATRAARSAAYATDAARAARSATANAAAYYAYDAIYYATWAFHDSEFARAAEKVWQKQRLIQYLLGEVEL